MNIYDEKATLVNDSLHDENDYSNIKIKILPASEGAVKRDVIPSIIYEEQFTVPDDGQDQNTLSQEYITSIEKLGINETLKQLSGVSGDNTLTTLQYNLDLWSEESYEPATIIIKELNGSCSVICRYRDTSIEEYANNYFDALCSVRLKLEEEKLYLKCYGASLNVHSIKALYEPTKGLAAYQFHEGKMIGAENLVFIFADGLDVVPVSVQEQKERWEDWLVTAPM